MRRASCPAVFLLRIMIASSRRWWLKILSAAFGLWCLAFFSSRKLLNLNSHQVLAVVWTKWNEWMFGIVPPFWLSTGEKILVLTDVQALSFDLNRQAFFVIASYKLLLANSWVDELLSSVHCNKRPTLTMLQMQCVLKGVLSSNVISKQLLLFRFVFLYHQELFSIFNDLLLLQLRLIIKVFGLLALHRPSLFMHYWDTSLAFMCS